MIIFFTTVRDIFRIAPAWIEWYKTHFEMKLKLQKSEYKRKLLMNILKISRLLIFLFSIVKNVKKNGHTAF